jgi:hypothetical protein
VVGLPLPRPAARLDLRELPGRQLHRAPPGHTGGAPCWPSQSISRCWRTTSTPTSSCPAPTRRWAPTGRSSASSCPIGISFFTFTQIAFLADAYAGKVTEYRFIYYVLFVTYFPHLIAGPVLHHKEMMPQFDEDRITAPRRQLRHRPDHLRHRPRQEGADRRQPRRLRRAGFRPHADAPSLFIAWGALAYTFQLYFDFSGYSDMAIGLSRLFGVRLPLNFDSPYKSRNITEFWRRWHMTLSRFLRDYLYIPLGGNRQGALRRHLNLMTTMVLGGLVARAGWNFVLWGTLHGSYLVINHAWQGATRQLPSSCRPDWPAHEHAAHLPVRRRRLGPFRAPTSTPPIASWPACPGIRRLVARSRLSAPGPDTALPPATRHRQPPGRRQRVHFDLELDPRRHRTRVLRPECPADHGPP